MLNRLVQSKPAFHLALAQKGLYIPKYKSKAITGPYLWNVFLGKIWVPKRSNTSNAFIPGFVSKESLFEAIEERLE